MADAVGGQIELIFDNLPSSMGQIQAGKLRAMAIAWPKRIDAIKDVPTFAEAGFPVLNQPVWYGLLAPKGTPMEVVNKLRDAAVIALKDPKVLKTLDDQARRLRATRRKNSPRKSRNSTTGPPTW